MNRKGGKGRGGKEKPMFTRVVPKFLQQYEHLLGQRPQGGMETMSGGGGGGRRGDDGFDGYDEAEEAALEEYRKKHPEREGKVDLESVRDKARALTERMDRGDEEEDEQEGDATKKRKLEVDEGAKKGAAEAEEEEEPEEPRQYLDDSGRIKFNKPKGLEKEGGDGPAAKKRKKDKGKKNAKLLSFDEDG